MTLCISHWRAADHPDNAAYIQAWDEISLSLLRQFEELGPREVTRGSGARRRRPTPPSCSSAVPPSSAPRWRPLTYAEPAAPGQWQRRHHDRHHRRDVHRRLQQRAGRRPHAPARQRRDRRPGSAAQHQPALPAPARHRARRAPGGHDAGRARHRPPGQLRQRGGRPGLAPRDGRHRPHRRAGDRLRLPRRDHGDGGAVARGVAWRLAAGARRAVRRPARAPARPGVLRRGDRQAAAGRARAGAGRRRHALHQRRHPRARRGLPRRASQQRPALREHWSWPTRCRPASAGPATTCGRSSARAWSPTWSPSASRWATATRSRPSSPAAATSRPSAARRSSSARSPAARSRPWRPWPCSTSSRTTTWSRTQPRWACCCGVGCGRRPPAARPCATYAVGASWSASTWPARRPTSWPPCRTGPASRAC